MMLNPVKMGRRLMVEMKLRKIRRLVERSQARSLAKSDFLKRYDLKLRPQRQELYRRVAGLYGQINSEQLMLLYLIYFSAIGAKMVKPADVWLSRWGAGLKLLGFDKMGEDLQLHAKGEVGHDRWHENDVRFLVPLYNRKYGTSLNVSAVLAQGDQPCVTRYRTAFESTLDGREYAALGMLVETELMTFTLAPRFIGHCVQELGFVVMRGLSFLRGHLIADLEHVEENSEMLHELLSKRTDEATFREIVRLGDETIAIYIDYFEQVMSLARAQLKNEFTGSAGFPGLANRP